MFFKTTISPLLSELSQDSFGRLLLSLMTIFVGVTLYHILIRLLVFRAKTTQLDKNRHKLVLVKNMVVLMCIVVIFFTWSPSLTHLALSLAAVAGAVLIVFKELILCWVGYFLINVARLYRVGDYIELNGLLGRVIDISAFSTSIAEEGGGHQLTGKTVNVPNSMVLAYATKNISATGKFIINLFRISVPFDVDFEAADKAALLAAQEISHLWHEEAGIEFERIEAVEFLNLPSAKPKIIWEPHDTKQHYLHIRFTCPIESRVAAEQECFRKFWRYYAEFSERPLPPSS